MMASGKKRSGLWLRASELALALVEAVNGFAHLRFAANTLTVQDVWVPLPPGGTAFYPLYAR